MQVFRPSQPTGHVGMGAPEHADSESDAVRALHDITVAASFYDQRYDAGYMDDADWSAEKRNRVADLIRELPLPASGRVLDYGCGTGVFTEVLRTSLTGWTVVGADLSTSALARARQRLPECRFLQIDDLESGGERYDLIFSHHVLEHVSDLPQTAAMLKRVSAPSGAMLHILPCGNPGSFAHRVCESVRNGIQHDAEDRFFFEEVGHLRRLTTERLGALWAADGLVIQKTYYSEQFYGALSVATQFDLGFVLAMIDPQKAVDVSAARRLKRLRAGLVCLWFLRKPAAVVEGKLRHGCRSLRDCALLAAGLVVYPLSKSVDWLTKKLASREWLQRRHDPRGSEMYVYLAAP